MEIVGEIVNTTHRGFLFLFGEQNSQDKLSNFFQGHGELFFTFVRVLRDSVLRNK